MNVRGFVCRDPRPPRAALACLFFSFLSLSVAIASPISAQEDLLGRGVEAYRRGDRDGAIEIWKKTGSPDDLLVRRFDAAVAQLESDRLEEATAAFEEVAAKAEGELSDRALFNLGCCRYRTASSLVEEAAGLEKRKEKIDKLTEATEAYRSASDFFRRVEASDEDTTYNIGVVKTAWIAVVDEIARLKEEERREREDELLREPARLLVRLIGAEKLHRDISRSLRRQATRRKRVAVRRLRRAEAENRVLTEKLLHLLRKKASGEETDPASAATPATPATPPAPAGPKPEEDEAAKERFRVASEAVSRAVESQKKAEVAYAAGAPGDAVEHHETAVVELRSARTAFPIDLPALVREARSTQERVTGAIDTLRQKPVDEKSGEGDGAGRPRPLGDRLLGALQSEVLQPLARWIATPERQDEARHWASEEDDVVWAANLLARAEIPPTPPSPAAGPPGSPSPPPAPGQPVLDAQAARELSKSVREAGAEAEKSAGEARGRLAEADADAAQAPAKTALEALRRIEALLPKPPEPLETRLRKLIERQKKAATAASALGELAAGEDREEGAHALAKSQREDGRTATGIAKELEARQQDPRAKGAAEKAREGEQHIFSSAESLDRALAREAEGSVKAAVKALEAALARLLGQDEKKKQPQKDRQQKKQEKQKKSGRRQQPKPDEQKGNLALTPRQARMLKEEMDRKRREEEKKLFAAPSSVTVEKDW